LQGRSTQLGEIEIESESNRQRKTTKVQSCTNGSTMRWRLVESSVR
jgi:hypothetical protein